MEHIQKIILLIKKTPFLFPKSPWIPTLQNYRQALPLPVDHFPSPSEPPSSLRFRSHLAISLPSFAGAPRRRPKPTFPQILQPISLSILKTTGVTLAAAAALFFMRVSGKPAVAAPIPPATGEELKERAVENNPNDVEALRSLMEERFNAKKFQEALNNVERLIELEPNENKWLVWRGFAYKEMGDSESARKDFETVLGRDPCRFRAHQGLVMLKMKSDIDSWDAILKRVEGALEIVKEHKGKGNKSEIRRFKLLIACIKCFKGSYSEALDDHLELEKEDPMDCFQHFHFGILYMALEKYDEADKQFEICERLAPKLPNKGYFGDDEDM